MSYKETKLGKIIFIYKSKNIRDYYKVVVKLKDINKYLMITYKSPKDKTSVLDEMCEIINLQTPNDTNCLGKFNKKQLLDYWDEYTPLDSYELKNIITKEERKEKIDKLFNSDEL